MRVRVVLGVALLLVAVALVVALSQRGERLAGTNFVKHAGQFVILGAGRTACQSTLLTDDAARAGLYVETTGGPLPPLDVSFTNLDGRLIARGHRPAGGPGGDVAIPLDRRVEGSATVLACVHNDGSSKVSFAGDAATPRDAAHVGGRAAPGVFALRYTRPGRESWWDLIPTIDTRFGVGKASWFGSWTLVVAGLLLLGAWIAAIRLLLRSDA